MTTGAETASAPAPRWEAREATPADYEQILAINREILVETAGQKIAGFSRALWEWQYLRPEERSLVSVADDHGTIAGYMHGLRFPYRYRGGRGGRAARALRPDDRARDARVRGHGDRLHRPDCALPQLALLREAHAGVCGLGAPARGRPPCVRRHEALGDVRASGRHRDGPRLRRRRGERAFAPNRR